MALKLIARKKDGLMAKLIMEFTYTGKSVEPGDQAMPERPVTGRYIYKKYLENEAAKLYYYGNFRYIVYVNDDHFYEFTSKIDLKG
jgi:hypothetical protein